MKHLTADSIIYFLLKFHLILNPEYLNIYELKCFAKKLSSTSLGLTVEICMEIVTADRILISEISIYDKQLCE